MQISKGAEFSETFHADCEIYCVIAQDGERIVARQVWVDGAPVGWMDTGERLEEGEDAAEAIRDLYGMSEEERIAMCDALSGDYDDYDPYDCDSYGRGRYDSARDFWQE